MLGFSVLISGASPVTMTSSLAMATFNVNVTVCVWPNPAVIPSLCCVSNPDAATCTEYVPGFNCGNMKRPE